MISVKLFLRDGFNDSVPASRLTDDLKKEGFDVKEYRLETVNGLAEGIFHGVIATPTLIVVDEDGKNIAAWRGKLPDPAGLHAVLSGFAAA